MLELNGFTFLNVIDPLVYAIRASLNCHLNKINVVFARGWGYPPQTAHSAYLEISAVLWFHSTEFDLYHADNVGEGTTKTFHFYYYHHSADSGFTAKSCQL